MEISLPRVKIVLYGDEQVCMDLWAAEGEINEEIMRNDRLKDDGKVDKLRHSVMRSCFIFADLWNPGLYKAAFFYDVGFEVPFSCQLASPCC